MLRRATVFAVLAVTLSTQLGCMKTVRLTATPKDAKITVDGQRVSGNPAVFTDSMGIGKSYVVKVEAPGHEPLVTTLRQETNAGCMIGWGVCGCLSGLGFLGMLFCQALPRDNYLFDLQPDRGGGGSAEPTQSVEPEGFEVLPTDPPL